VFIFTPKIGEDEPILTSIFFRWVQNTKQKRNRGGKNRIESQKPMQKPMDRWIGRKGQIPKDPAILLVPFFGMVIRDPFKG